MVKKIRVIDETADADAGVATGNMDGTMKEFMEMAKTMDWKLWEILQIMQRLEKKLNSKTDL